MIDILEDEVAKAVGQVTVWQIDELTNEKVVLFSCPNLVMYKWAYIVAKSIGHKDANYGISGMFIEYYNVTNPSDVVTVPTYARGDQLAYYTGLASPGDYLRVPLSSLPSITIQSGYETYFTAPEGNVLNFSAQTSGTTGVLGRAFSNVNNSKVFGCALIATPIWSDATKDLIFARTYFPTGQQQLKIAGSQIGVTWSIPLL